MKRPDRTGLLARACVAAWLLAGAAAVSAFAATGATSPPSAAGDAALPAPADLRALAERARSRPDATVAALQALRARSAGAGATRLELLTLLGLALGDLNRGAAMAEVQRELDTLGRDHASAAARAAALTVAANLERQQGELTRAEADLGAALTLSPAPPSSIERFRLQHMLTRVRYERGDLDQALAAAQETARIARALQGEPDGALLQARALDQLAYVLQRAGQNERALEFNAQAWQWAVRAGNPAEQSRVRNTEGNIRSNTESPARSLEPFEAALSLAREAGWKAQEVLVLSNVADVHLRGGRFDAALAAAQQALAGARALGDSSAESLALTNLGLAELGLRRVDAGRQHIDLALAIERRKGARAEEAAILVDAAAAYERAGDLRAAIAAHHQLRVLQDSLDQRDHQRAVLDLQERYEREQREREMAALGEQGAMQDAELRGHAMRQRAWALGTVAGGLLLAVGLLLLRQDRRDNRAMAQANAQLRVQGGQDPLTGLSNRRRVQDVLRGRAAAFAGTLLMLDLDHFKRVNDSAGHATGDVVLVEVARRLREVLRDADLLARWGGEEFLVLLPALPAEQTEQLVERLLTAIGGTPFEVDGRGLPVTASIGYASFPLMPAQCALPWERAVGLVDAALFHAKTEGRNRACGIRLMRAADDAAVARIERDLAAARRRGDVALAEVRGRVSPTPHAEAWA